jgi:2-hydroxychromene-2-carboxylate isomerase
MNIERRRYAEAPVEGSAMSVTVYGDFNCAYSYLASQRADSLSHSGVTVDWRAIEHDPRLPMTGRRSDDDLAGWKRELEEVAALALPGERPPATPPPAISNTSAAIAAYAEAVTDGIADALRRSLFDAIWTDDLHISGADEVRRVITRLTFPQGDISVQLASPDFPCPVLRDPDLTRVTRRLGGTIAPYGIPLTTAGWQRIRRWRQEWLALPRKVIPAVIGPDQVMRAGTDGLRYLAELASYVRATSAAAPSVGGQEHQLVNF